MICHNYFLFFSVLIVLLSEVIIVNFFFNSIITHGLNLKWFVKLYFEFGSFIFFLSFFLRVLWNVPKSVRVLISTFWRKPEFHVQFSSTRTQCAPSYSLPVFAYWIFQDCKKKLIWQMRSIYKKLWNVKLIWKKREKNL